MQLQIVNKDIAKELKELEFYIDTNGKFVSINPYNENESICIINKDLVDIKDLYFNNNKLLIKPEQSIVIKWFREVHNIRIFIEYSEANGTYKYSIRIPKENNKDIDWYMERIGSLHSFDTYELAEEKGILNAIEILKLWMKKTT